MFRFSRLLLCRAKEYNHGQNIYRPVSSKQNFVESLEAKTQVDEGIEDTKQKNNDLFGLNEIKTKIHSERQASADVRNHQKRYDKIFNPLEMSSPMTEEEASLWAKSLTPEKIVEIMKFLANAKNRPIKLLQVLSERINSYPHILNLKDCANLMYYFGIFSLKNQVLLDKIANDILLNKNNFQPGGLPTSLLQSCGILKYRNCELLDVLLQQILHPNSTKTNKSLLTALLTLSTVNYFPPYGKIILTELLKCSLKDFSQTKLFLDFVWASILLNHYSEDHISKVLSEDFVNQLQVAKGYFGHSETLELKLLNINAAVTYFLPSYKGPKLKKKISLDLISKKKSLFMESVIDGLSHIFPKNGYLQLNVPTKAGFVLDIECYMDSSGNPIPLKKKKDSQKIGIMLLDFNDFCLSKDSVESGLVAFKEKIFRAMDYKIVKINYLEFNTYTKLYEKVHYLQNKLEVAVKTLL